MALQHLHLHVKSRLAAETFYAKWFGLTVKSAGERLTFMCDERQFLLALMDDEAAEPLPGWFHFGMKLGSPAQVLALHARMSSETIPIVKDVYQDEALVSYRCADPDGHVIEVYWQND